MANEMSFVILYYLLGTASGLILTSNTCELSIVAKYTACQSFFNDANKIGDTLSNLQSTLTNLQHDLDLLSVRLDGGTAYKGVVQVYQNGYWGSICDSGWDQADADVVCRMLGYSSAWAHTSGHITSSPYAASLMNCNGNENSIFKCSKLSTNTYFGCDYNRAAGAECKMGIRLVGSTADQYRGRVEVQHMGEWGTICDTNWTSNDAAIVCRMLGMRGGRAVSGATFGAGVGRIILSDIGCLGSESHLLECTHAPFRLHTCHHSSDVGVVCQPNK